MTPTSTRTELEESILTCCKSLFLTSAIPELIKQDGTPKQIEYLAVALQKEITRRDENKRARLVKRARFPIYKTFEGYEYRCCKTTSSTVQRRTGKCLFYKREKQPCTLWTCRHWQNSYGNRHWSECVYERL